MSSNARTLLGKPPRSVGVTLLATSAALTAMVAALALSTINDGLTRYANVARLENIGTVTNDLLQASEDIAFERDTTLAALSETDRREAARLALSAQQARARAIASGADALSAVEADPTLQPWAEQMRQRLGAIDRVRRQADRINAGPQRRGLAGKARAAWQTETARYIDEADALWLEIVRPHGAIDATATQQLRYLQVLAAIYDYSGRERSIVAEILSDDEAGTTSQLAQMNHAQGVLDVSWRAAHDLAVQGDFYQNVEADFVGAKSHYDTLHGMLNEAFYAPTATGAGLPISSALWLELCDQYAQSLDQLRATSRRSLAERLDLLRHKAVAAIAFQVAVLAIAMALCGFCAWVVSRVVVRPINAIAKALVAASRGEAFALAKPRQPRSDEIGQLVEVLHVLEGQAAAVRKTAAELDASERRLRAILDNTLDGLITIDEKGDIEAVNPASERLFGYASNELIGQHVSLIMPGLFRGHDEPASASLSSPDAGEPKLNLAAASASETIAVRKDRSCFPIELTLSEINLASASLLSALVRDISPRRAAEAVIITHTQALERSNRELDDFAYIASHDLKEPLRGLHNHARFLLEDNGGKLDEDSVRRLNRLVALTQRMERLVNDLLYFSRLGRQELAVHATDLSGVVRDIEATLDHFLEEAHARIVMPEPLPTTICDAPRASELLRNLITNAVKYNDKSDKLVEIGFLATKTTPLGALRQRVFYVADNGSGIAPEFHQEVFRIFKRLNNHRASPEGTGVGLTFVKKIVERHGGEIWIKSTPGEGATFFFTLEPAHEERSLRAA